jgi:hypothetical protein
MAKYSCVVATVLFAITSVLSASAATHALGDASTSGFSQGSASGSTARGWEFQVNAANVQVVQLGVNAWTDGTPLTLSLWNDNTQTLLAQTTAISSASNWVFANLVAPVSLTSGGLYSVIGWANVVGNPWYQFNINSPAAFTPIGTIQYTQALFDNGANANTFPGFTRPAPEQYGVTDIGYQIVPEPSTLALLTLGAVGLLARRRVHAGKAAFFICSRSI